MIITLQVCTIATFKAIIMKLTSIEVDLKIDQTRLLKRKSKNTNQMKLSRPKLNNGNRKSAQPTSNPYRNRAVHAEKSSSTGSICCSIILRRLIKKLNSRVNRSRICLSRKTTNGKSLRRKRNVELTRKSSYGVR